jgi:hypothetical protein
MFTSGIESVLSTGIHYRAIFPITSDTRREQLESDSYQLYIFFVEIILGSHLVFKMYLLNDTRNIPISILFEK